MNLSDFETRALTLIQEYPKGIHTRAFAKSMWPDSRSWRRTYNCGVNGATRGTGIMMCAGQNLARLANKGLLVRTHKSPSGWYRIRYHVSGRGLELLKGARTT